MARKNKKKNKNIIFHEIIDLSLYGDYRLHIVIAKNICKARNKFHKELCGKVDETEDWGGMHSYKDSNVFQSFIFLPIDTTSSVIAHESFHATLRIMKVIGAKLNKGSEESYAYLLDHIVDYITQVYLSMDKDK